MKNLVVAGIFDDIADILEIKGFTVRAAASGARDCGQGKRRDCESAQPAHARNTGCAAGDF